MKKFYFQNNGKVRINNVIGQSDVGVGGEVDPSITPWSVQATILSNLYRMCKGIVGGGVSGRVLNGLDLTKRSGASLDISSGVGITSGGELVELLTGITVNTPDISDGNYFVYLINTGDDPIDSTKYEDGKRMSFVGPTPSVEVVYDDFISAKKNDIKDFANDVVLISSTSSSSDVILLGTFVASSGTILTVETTPHKGFTSSNGLMKTTGLETLTEKSLIRKGADLYEVTSILSDVITGILNIGASSQLRLDVGSSVIVEDGGDNTGQSVTINYKKPDDNPGTMVFKKGILTSYT